MSGEETYLGIEIATRQLTAVLVDGAGHTVESSHLPQTPDDLRDPQWLLEQVRRLMESLTKPLGEISSLALTGPATGGTFFDRDGASFAPGFLPGDKEAAAYTSYFEATARRSRAISGTLAAPDRLGVQLVFQRDRDPTGFARLDKVLSLKDGLFFLLTGDAATDPTTASASGLYDPVEGTWAPRILTPLGFDESLLPKVQPSLAGLACKENTLGEFTGRVVCGASRLAAVRASLGQISLGAGLIDLADDGVIGLLNDAFLPHPLREVTAEASLVPGLFDEVLNLGDAEAYRQWAEALVLTETTNFQDPLPYFLPGLEHGAAMAGVRPDTPPEHFAAAVRTGFAYLLWEAAETLDGLGSAPSSFALTAKDGLAESWGPYLASALDCDLAFHDGADMAAAHGAALMARASARSLSGPEAFPARAPSRTFKPNAKLRAHFEHYRPGLAALKSRLTQA